MLLEFMNLGMRISALIGIPMFCILGPIHYIFGGNAAGEDHLSYFSFGNIRTGEKWHYWVYAFVVWAVVSVVHDFAFKAQKRFCSEEFRYKWLRELPVPRATTVLVENIPRDQQSDVELKRFFESLFAKGGPQDSVVSSAFVVKDTKALLAAQKLADTAKFKMEEAQTLACSSSSSSAAAAPDPALQQTFEAALAHAEELRSKLLKDSTEVGGVNMSAGFVTFKSRTDALISENVTFSDSYDNMIVSVAPPSQSILWEDLREGQNVHIALEALGYGLIIGLFIAYMPIVLWISQLAVNFDMGLFQPAWQSVAPTMGLTLMVDMLPTFLMLIFKNFFTLNDSAWAQLKLQKMYFVFQVVFVIGVTAVGSNATTFFTTLAEHPTQLPMILGTTMPYATHFYMNFLVLQWMTHSMNMLRYMNLTKYACWRGGGYEKEKASEYAEPED
jgi:hypothetical protein